MADSDPVDLSDLSDEEIEQYNNYLYERYRYEINLRKKVAAVASCLSQIYLTRLRRRRPRRRLWSRQWLMRRNDEGVLKMLFNELGPEDPKSFRNYTRMGEEVLTELLTDVEPLIRKQDTVMREAITPRDRLAATLRFLAAGNTFKDLSYSTRIAPNTLSEIIPETLKAIVDVLKKKQVVKCPSTSSEWEAVAEKFHSLWQFPHCLGAIDGKHIDFRPARSDGSKFRNYKGRDSIVLLALVDATYQFLFVDVGRNGRMNDGAVLRDSSLAHHLYAGTLGLPSPCPLPGGTVPSPYVIVADDAFPLKTNIMKPYPGRNMSHENKIFNYRLSRARRVVENAFGIMSNRFRIFLSPICLSVEKVELITLACAYLHNFLLQKYSEWYISEEFQDGGGTSQLQSVSRQGGNHATQTASGVRDTFRMFFNTVGKVPWQEKAMEGGHY